MDPVPTDADLVARCLAGDAVGWEVLVRRHRDTAWRAALVFTGEADAEDVVQDAFVKAYSRLHQLRAGDGFLPWLLAIVRNLSRNTSRGESRRRIRDLRLVPDEAGPDPTDLFVESNGASALLGVNLVSSAIANEDGSIVAEWPQVEPVLEQRSTRLEHVWRMPIHVGYDDEVHETDPGRLHDSTRIVGPSKR